MGRDCGRPILRDELKSMERRLAANARAVSRTAWAVLVLTLACGVFLSAQALAQTRPGTATQRIQPRPDPAAGLRSTQTDDRDESSPTPSLKRQRDAFGNPIDTEGQTTDGVLRDTTNLDGVLAEMADADQPADGAADVPLRRSPDFEMDGVAGPDGRFPDDVAAFENPPAGFDPRAFEIEIAPILDRRPAQLARFEPYDPVGIRAGSFTIFPEAEFALSATNNLLRTNQGRKTDSAFEFRPQVRAVSNWRVHALEFRAAGDTSFYREHPSEDDRAYTLEMRGRIDITRRTNLELMASRDYSQEQRGGIEAEPSQDSRPNLTTDRFAATLNHRFNRLSVQLRAGLTEVDYSTDQDADGIVLGNDDRDFRERQVAARVAWAFKPTLSIFSEIEHLRRIYTSLADDGVDRDASGERYRAGVSFGNTGQKLRGEVSVGWGTEHFDAAGIRSIDGVILDANLAWRPTALTSFLWTAKSDLSPSTSTGTTGVKSRSTALEARHAFRRHLIGTAAVRWNAQDYQGPASVEERELLLELGAEYFLNREVSVFTRYQHINFTSTVPGGGYEADEVRLGMRWRR